MKKLVSLVAVFAGLAGAAAAIEPVNAPAFTCGNASSRLGNNFAYCLASNYTSGTTSAQLGSIRVDPNKRVFVLGVANQAALSGQVTPTVSLFLGSTPVGTRTISVSTAGNLVDLGAPIAFDTVTISTSLPGTISATNSLTVGVIENLQPVTR